MPTSFFVFAYLTVIGAGFSLVFQQAINANLRAEIGSPLWAGFVSYLGGTLTMLVVAMLLREPLPSVQELQRSHWLSWSGGFFGAVYIGVSILLIPRLGAAMVIALMVAGQMLGSLAFDHFGILGLPVHSLTLTRLAGAALLVTGVVLIRY
jgi:transporter family-2 protein